MRYFLTIVIAAMLMSCQPRPLCEGADFSSLPSRGWAYGDTLQFYTDMADSLSVVSMAVVVRHTNDYQYSNLWLELTATDGQNADSLRRDTVNVILADQFGRWHGSGSGLSFVLTDTLPNKYTVFKDRPINVRHIMRVDTLHDIEQIGLIFIPENATEN